MRSVVVIALLIPVILVYLKDYKKGLFFSFFMLIFLPEYLVIETPAALPNLTIHRLIFFTTLFFWFIKFRSNQKFSDVQFYKVFMIFVIVNVLSVIFSADFFPSLKQFISFTIEVLVFYFLISTSLEDESELIKSLNIAWFALAAIAFFAVVERYFDFQISSLVPGYVRRLGTETQLKSTLPHRILLGTTMAMAFPIALVMTIYYRGRWFKQLIYWGSVIIFAGSCYFSTSRGPWLGLVLAFVILSIIGSNIVRKRIIMLVALVIIGLLTRPGVWTTLNARVSVTMDDTSFKGGTYQYRWELWKRAYESITMAPHRFLFGYGPGTSETMNWEGVEGFSQE